MNELVDEIDLYLNKLFPLARSITGSGNRETLKILQELVPLKIKEYKSGTPVYDWTIPDEWIVREAWIKDSSGNILVDFSENNVHLVSYSEPINCKKMTLENLLPHLHYREDLPEVIPYRTSYYQKDWGFCVNKKQYEKIVSAGSDFEILIDSEFQKDGSMSIGELLIPSRFSKEILISTYFCHPSLANDNLSGAVMTAFLARELLHKKQLNYSYRIVFVPETIGAIAYSANNENSLKNIDLGFVVTCVGGHGSYGYKQSFNKEYFLNHIIEDVFKEHNLDYITYPFDIHGSDERQYSSQGFRINMVSLTKDKYYEYPYYHTSYDNLDNISATNLLTSMDLHIAAIEKIDKNLSYINLNPNCEVMLSKHDLYPSTGGALLPGNKMNALDIRLWLLFLCDGNCSLFDISKQLGVPINYLYEEAEVLVEKGIMKYSTAFNKAVSIV